MTTQPPSGLGLDALAPAQPSGQPQPAREEKKLLAPVWHTVLLIVMLLANSYFTAMIANRVVSRGAGSVTEIARIVQYALTIAFELFLLFLVWVGLRLKQTKIRELIGGRWDTPEAFLMDVAIAVGFWIVAAGILYGLSVALGLAKTSQIAETKKLAEMLAPHTWRGLALFIALSTVAGFVEEILFRGYLQRQLGAITGNIYVGLVASAAVFGGGHGYEGTRRMIVIFVFGMMFGFLALWRKSLRPGMIAHAWHDAFSGVLLFIVARKGFPAMP